jgi:hypothetical protein
VELILGRTTGSLPLGLELIDFLFLWLGKHSFRVSKRRLSILCLDHFPILLDCGDFHKGCRYLKFENMLLKSEGFLDRVK